MFLLRRLVGRSHDLNTTGSSNVSSHGEDEALGEAFRQANEDVVEGNYERALWLLEKVGQSDLAIKGVAELVAVAEVCKAAALSSCTCLYKGNKKPDWYSILKVDEKSDDGDIKKMYRHLALLLHPDKNKHVKAEAAFKLVSEAYASLTDKKKRANFNEGRARGRCRRCNPRDCVASEFERWSTCGVLQGRRTGLQRPGSSPDRTLQGDWILDQERLKLFRARARARVVSTLTDAWEESRFTRIEELYLGRKRFGSSKVDRPRRNPNQERCVVKIHGNETDGAELCPRGVMNSDEKEEHGMVVVETYHQQIARPCKTLDSLIQDLRAELISGVESRGDHHQAAEDAIEQELTTLGKSLEKVKENHLDLQMVDCSLLGGFAASCNTCHVMRAPAAGVGFLERDPQGQIRNEYGLDGASLPAVLSSSFQIHPSPPRSLSNTMGEDTISEVCCKKECLMCKSTCALCLAPRKPGMKCGLGLAQRYTEKQHFGAAKQDGESIPCTNVPWRLHRDDSLDMEETILQKQKEKSEQLLRTLQRLREETKTVAASLDHLRRY